jgi:hypothetical protein
MSEATAVVDIQEAWENKGSGVGGRTLFLDYFPIASNSVQLVTIDSSGTKTVLEEQDSLNFSDATDRHFSVNYELGTIQVGGYQAPDLRLLRAVSASALSIVVYPDKDAFESYPDYGVIEIDGEKIYYNGRDHYTFNNCYRGYGGTTALPHLKGAKIEDLQHGESPSGTLYVCYTAVPRVDYEVTDYTLRTASRRTGWLDISPVSNVITNSVLQIVSGEQDLAEIVLETDSPLIGGNIYGPVYYGTDVSRLTATAYDSRGNVVDNIELTIEITDGPGSLNGSGPAYFGYTNSEGQISCIYNAPYSEDDVCIEVTDVVHSGGNTTLELAETILSATPVDIWTFQILKHDSIVGTTGVRIEVIDGGSASQPWGNGYLDVEAVLDEFCVGGVIHVVCSDSVRRTYSINSYHLIDGATGRYTRLFVSEVVTSVLVAGMDAWLIEANAVTWDSSVKSGARVILYEWTTDALHPTTGLAGAYTPLHPDEVSGNELVFYNRTLTEPEPDNDESNLGAYVVIAPQTITLQAKGIDPYTGHVVESNIIRLRLSLPATMVGVDNTGALPIPYGFTLVTDDFNIGSGIGGANFITINPVASGINQFSIKGTI